LKIFRVNAAHNVFSPRYWHTADTWQHVVVAVVSLFLGFGTAKQSA
jgi:hypothetical protein